MNSSIIDGLVHLEGGLEDYDLQVTARNIVFNFVDQYRQKAKEVPAGDSITLVFDYKKNLDFVLKEIQAKKIRALKIHSRDQQIRKNDYPELIKNLSLAPAELPVIVDAFYYGPELEFKPSLEGIIQIAQTFPQRKIVVAHSGGYEVLKYFCHLRPLDNIFYDLSFSLQYLEDSSVFSDLKKLIRHTDKKRILFGSDFPYASPKKQAEIFEKLSSEIGLTEDEKSMIWGGNSKKLYFSPY